MFFEDISHIKEISGRTGAALFVVPDEVEVSIPGALLISPEGRATIAIEQIRDLIAKLELKQSSDLFVVIRPADKMGLEAANAFLKCLEEPGEKIHFVLVTSEPSLILPTILSRAAVYFLRVVDSGGISADKKTKEIAKRLMVAKGPEVVGIAEEIAKKKDGVREYAMSIIGAAIEMLYRTYFLTGKEAFLLKIPKFLKVYESLARNGHIKLSIVAGLI